MCHASPVVLNLQWVCVLCTPITLIHDCMGFPPIRYHFTAFSVFNKVFFQTTWLLLPQNVTFPYYT